MGSPWLKLLWDFASTGQTLCWREDGEKIGQGSTVVPIQTNPERGQCWQGEVE